MTIRDRCVPDRALMWGSELAPDRFTLYVCRSFGVPYSIVMGSPPPRSRMFRLANRARQALGIRRDPTLPSL